MTPHEQLRDITNRALLRSDFTCVDYCLAGRPHPLVIDIGTNTGGFIPHWFGQGAREVHAFEPVPAVFDELKKHYGHDPRVVLNQLAVSDAVRRIEGVQILNAHTLAPAATTKLAVALEDTGPFTIHTTTLDGYLKAKNLRADFIKLDVDGYEPMALRGMRQTLMATRPPIMIELSFLPRALGESVEAMIDGLYALEYKLCTMSREVCEEPLFVLEAFPWRTSFDMVAVPNETISSSWPRVR